MIKIGSNEIIYISTGATPALCVHIGDKCVYPYNGSCSRPLNNVQPNFYYKTFSSISTGPNIHVASPHLWAWGDALVSDGTIIYKNSDTSPFVKEIPYIKPSHAGNVRWDCFIDYTNTTTNVYSIPMCSFYIYENYYLSKSLGTTTVTFNLGSGVCKFTIQMPEEISPPDELSYPSILNYFDTTNSYNFPVKINRTMFNATIY